jgi:hypothetical protein
MASYTNMKALAFMPIAECVRVARYVVLQLLLVPPKVPLGKVNQTAQVHVASCPTLLSDSSALTLN